MKNNTPACILIDPEKYEEMIEHSKIMLYISRRKNECIIPEAITLFQKKQ
jgi:hypothetical protein